MRASPFLDIRSSTTARSSFMSKTSGIEREEILSRGRLLILDSIVTLSADRINSSGVKHPLTKGNPAVNDARVA